MRLALILLVAGCGPVTVSSVAYTTACPEGDRQCEIRQNAETLYYMSHPEAADALLCSGDTRDVMGALCSIY
jgi:hypothetical protein